MLNLLRRLVPLRTLCVVFSLLFISGCVALDQGRGYLGPKPRTAELEQYYTKGRSYLSFSEQVAQRSSGFQVKRISIASDAGQITIDYFQRNKINDDLILVFPLLGGKNMVADYFAAFFADRGFDTAIVHRVDDFKKPENIDRFEELLRQNVVRDRIALDFFEREYGKRDFGSFGISRGGINVAMTAGVDPRLKYNVIALGGSDLVSVMRDSDQKRLKKILNQVMKNKEMSEEQVLSYLDQMIKTDPKYLAAHMDSRNTLMFLSLFDKTVPFKNGMQLREQIGNPKTIFLPANHYTSAAFTQFIKVLPDEVPVVIFPAAYIESEAFEFYKRSFKRGHRDFRMLPLRLLQLPFDIIGNIVSYF